MFKKLENNRPFLKMALEGFAGDGKSFTATQLAIGLHKLINSKKPIAIFDTEKAFKALTRVFAESGVEAIVNDEARSLASLSEAISICEQGEADILIIDSITHVWESYLQSYLKEKKKTRLTFEDWGVLKPKWKEEFSTPFVQANCHIIFTGRAGYEYTDEKNAETGKREIYKSGIKMKAETETAFEPDILVLMEKELDILGDKKSVWRNATIIKDRTNTIDGKTFRNPSFDDFYPAFRVLLDGTLKEVYGITELPDTFAEFDNRFSEIGRERDVLIAEVEGCFELMGLGTGAKDKQIKAWVLSQVYKVNSIEAVCKIKNELIKSGLGVIRTYSEQYKEYLSECLDSGSEPEKDKLTTMMKDLLSPAKAAYS